VPCYLFTFHAYGTWMPDREEGFVRRKHGVLPPDEELAKDYREEPAKMGVSFNSRIQVLLVEESQIACEKTTVSRPFCRHRSDARSRPCELARRTTVAEDSFGTEDIIDIATQPRRKAERALVCR